MSEVSEKFSRQSGTEWFQYLYEKEATVVGQGGIGSWLTLYLSRIGIDLQTYDGDTYEPHNMTGQLINTARIGTNKASAMAALCIELAGENSIQPNAKMFDESCSTKEITLCGLDNMAARKLVFETWLKTHKTNTNAIFIDGRCLINQFQVFCIKGGDEKAIKEYSEKWLFSDEESLEAPCSMKQSSHIASMTGAVMTNVLTNWASNKQLGLTEDVFITPFKTEYIAGLNLLTNETV